MHSLKSTLPFILAAATLALADTTRTSTSADSAVNIECASGDILQQCIQSMQYNLANCAPHDWNCQCTNSTNIVECYNNCPDDASRKDAESTRQRNCANSKAHAPASTAPSTPRPTATSSTDIHDGTDVSDSDAGNHFKEGLPIISYSGLEANLITRPEEGTASGLKVGSWLGLLGVFALGGLF